MISDIVYDIKHFLRSGNMVSKLIVANIFVSLILFLFNIFVANPVTGIDLYKYVLLSMNAIETVKHPWSIISYMFVSKSIIHFVFNMFFLYWFGSLLGDLIGDRKILPLYILGGIAGAASYLILGNLIYGGAYYYIAGVDSVILSIVVAVAVLAPDYRLNLVLIGDISLKIVAFIYITLEFLYAFSSHNPVYLSYVGSAVFGWYYIYSMRHGYDLSKLFNKIQDKILSFFSFSKNNQKRKLSVKYKSGTFQKNINRKSEAEHNKELNRILDKIKRVGYENLNEEEKEFLFLASKRE